METVAKPPSALVKLGPRLTFLSEQGADLLERDLKGREQQCLERHFRRIWEHMEPGERDALRSEIEFDDPFAGKDVPHSYVDFRCLRAIAEFFADQQHRLEDEPL